MRKFLRAAAFVFAALYPVLVFCLLVVFRLPARVLSLCVVALGFGSFLAFSGGGKKSALSWKPLLSSGLLVLAGTLCFVTDRNFFLRLYPVAVSATFLFVFAGSLAYPPSIVFRLAIFSDRTIRGSVHERQVERYCRKVTFAWCVFFVANGTVSCLTVFFADDKAWSIYNGGISYVLMGIFFAVELLIRRRTDRKMIKGYSITKFSADSRKDEEILCYEGAWSRGEYKTWLDFLGDTAKMRAQISASGADDWILHCEDYWYFLVTFTALLQCGKRVLLTQNIAENFIREIKADGVEFLTDQKAEGSRFIPDMVENFPARPEAEIRSVPKISAEDTRILMYTSGSTGKPKAVPQRMKEFEEDNAFIISKWGDEFAKRKLVTTVSQHHIYGFLFGISLPFTLAVPFRRKRMEFPEEFLSLGDEPCMVIATPAFLKRAVETERSIPLCDPWIFTSGGAVSEELAARTKEVFGFCPLEVYGSTETSGIAYRQQAKDGLAWTPFDNAKVWKGDDGCLRIISPYIKDSEGFATADLVEMLDGGKFLLKGRSDSIVKIEEKRISLTEMESRIMESGLVSDVKVVALDTGVRQCLAAAVALNEKGREKFKGVEKYLVNRHFHDFLMNYFENVVLPKRWRFVDRLPADVQGKKHKEEILAMFKNESE